MGQYIERISDAELQRSLGYAGALFIRGPRACGKTSSAKRFAQSFIQLDRDSPEAYLAKIHPSTALSGPNPRLIDEWQVVPSIWNEVRHAVDDSGGQKGLFILTGSATPNDDAVRHSGAGRIKSVTMRTMSLRERGIAAEPISLQAIANGTATQTAGTDLTVADYVDLIVAGGFPELYRLDPVEAQELMRSYLAEMSEHDYPDIGGDRRDPRRFMSFLRAYAGLIAQPATGAAIRKRIGGQTMWDAPPAIETVNSLHDFASRLFLVEDQYAWSPNARSKIEMVQMPKRQLADPGLAAALLGLSPDKLLGDLETLGIFFEAQMTHDLQVYAQAIRARGVFHLRDTKGRDEIDAVIELNDGAWIGVEAKLSHHHTDEAAAQLLKVAGKLEQPPAALIVVIPTGPAYQRPDGVWVVPLGALAP